MQRVFLPALTIFHNSQRWGFFEMSSEHGAKISWQSNGECVRDAPFPETDLVVCGKKREFWEVLTAYYLSYFFFVYYFINKYSILFPIQWINQISFLFFRSNHYFNTFISPYFFNYKISPSSKTLYFFYLNTFLIYLQKMRCYRTY